MRRDVAFQSKGVTCRGYFYIPEGLGSGRKAPTIVMAHGFSAVKEQTVVDNAERFCAAGFACLAFDYRHLGASDGEPREQIFPWEQVEDYRNAITYVSELPEADSERIGVWGTSYSGGHVLCVGALDRRVKCVVSQVPAVDGAAQIRLFGGTQNFVGLQELLLQDRLARTRSGVVNYLPVVAEDANCLLPGKAAYSYFMETATTAPNWVNRVTWESIDQFVAYVPAAFAPRVSPTPLLMIVATREEFANDVQLATFERALPPKRAVVVPGGHFDVYRGPGFDLACNAAIEWYREWL